MQNRPSATSKGTDLKLVSSQGEVRGTDVILQQNSSI